LDGVAVDAVIFDWGGTLTRWHDVDFHEESLALAQAVVQTAEEPVDVAALAPRLHDANGVIWGRSRDEQRSATIDDLFTEAGLDHDPELLHAYYDFWVPHTEKS
jgi:putative hydrolase of the HAD superfamily